MNPPSGHSRPLYTVSELTREIKVLLEQEFPLVWIVGEISNLRTPTSGHHYFTLKDANAQINSVMFKGPAKRLKFTVADGLHTDVLIERHRRIRMVRGRRLNHKGR